MKLNLPFQRTGSLLALAILLIVSIGFHVHLKRIKALPAVDVAIEQLPKQLGKWEGQDTKGIDIRSQEILQLTRYVKRSYQRPDGATVTLYIGYWQKQSGDYQAAKHSPLLCLPSNGWSVRHKEPVQLSFAEAQGSKVQAKRIIGEMRNQAHLFYYWFFTGEENYSEEWRALMNISLQKFFYGRSDGGIIELSTPIRSGISRQAAEDEASAIIEDFLNDLYPELHRLIVEPKETPVVAAAATL